MPTRCFLLEPTDRVRQSLRRYRSSAAGDAAHGDACPLMPGQYSYHNAAVAIEDTSAIRDEQGHITNNIVHAHAYDGDPRWPTHCGCGYAFTDDDARQLSAELIYRRVDTGAEMTLREAPAGAMWWCDWMGTTWHPQLGRMFCVRLPDGSDWMPDMQAENCTLPDDRGQERHHCWIVEGTALPDISVNKNGPTCAAGAGSILTPGYHGFLTNGELTP